MIVHLHKQAHTTPAIRAEIRVTPASVSNPELAARYGVTLTHAVTHNSHGIEKYAQTNLQVIDYHNQEVAATQACIIQ